MEKPTGWAGWVLLTLFLARALAAPAPAPPPPAPPPSPPVAFSVPHRWCEGPFTLELTAGGLPIRYTVDGQEPTGTAGSEYAGPMQVTNTALIRAAAFQAGKRVSQITTRSYLFLEQARHQPSGPRGFPSGPDAWNGEPSIYAMDRRVVEDPVYRDRMTDALKSLPVLSIVCPKADLFGSANGIYVNPLQRGESWERACSVELIPNDGTAGFQIDCGIRVQGNYNRIPEKSPKHSFRLLFKKEYGASKLHYAVFPDSRVGKFDTLVLRADYNNSWIHWDTSVSVRGQRIRDAWMKDSQRAMGWLSGHNRYVHLFLDGLYWGVYDIAERPDTNFAASYLGGEREDYDVINEFQVKGGTRDAFNSLRSLHGVARNPQYEKLQQQLDVTEYIDYLLLNYYGGNRDWGERKNWYAVRRRQPAGPFRYFVWDGEQIFQHVREDIVSQPYENPFRLAEELRGNAEFRLAFADRVQRHCFNGGALTPDAVTARWMARAKELDLAIIAESARWGGFRRDPPYTRDRDWLAEQRRLVTGYFPRRTDLLVGQLRNVGLYPAIAAPVLRFGPGSDEKHRMLTISPADSTVYYTTNGVDPRVYGTGVPSPDARTYTAPVPVGEGMVVKCRVLSGGVWSALVEVENGDPKSR